MISAVQELDAGSAQRTLGQSDAIIQEEAQETESTGTNARLTGTLKPGTSKKIILRVPKDGILTGTGEWTSEHISAYISCTVARMQVLTEENSQEA